MTTFSASATASNSPAAEHTALRRHGPVFLLLGVLMMLMGAAAIGWSCLATLTATATWLFGFLLVGAGIAEIVGAYRAGRWSGRIVHVLIGLLYIVVGVMIIDEPVASAIRLTLMVSIFLIVTGIFRILFALGHNFAGSGAVLFNGVLTLILGLMIYKQWPASGLWAIGLFIGIELFFNGWTWIMLSLGLRRLPPTTAATPAAA